MMDADGANIRHNEVLGEVAVLCKGCQVAILNQIGDIHDEGTPPPPPPPHLVLSGHAASLTPY